MNDKPAVLMAGGVPIKAPSAENMQLMMILWGDSGSGKTTLAATAPGHKLFILFDPGGDLSLVDRDDVSVLDLSSQSSAVVMGQFRTADPYSLTTILRSRPDIETVIIDSMTSLAYLALQEAVTRAGGAKISMEQPGIQGYAYRNASLLRVTTSIMRACMMNKRHMILTTHEGPADKTEEGVVKSITMSLSDSVASQVGLRFNEVWHVEDADGVRRIAVRPCRSRRPMKTRLFNADKLEFEWHYNPNTHVGDGIADWYLAWQEGKGRKLALPVRAASTITRGVQKKGPH